MSGHLHVTKSGRGFKLLPPIPGIHGDQPAGEVRVYESSAASGPHLWLSVTQPADRNHPDNGHTIEATVHLAAEDAWRLADQLRYLVEHHYQGTELPLGWTPPKEESE